MIEVKVDTADAKAQLAGLAPRVRERAADIVAKNAALLRDAVAANAPGALADSIAVDMRAGEDGIEAVVSSDAPYARIREYGGRIAAPEIVPKAAKVLAFRYNGKLVFARHAQAHTVDMPAEPYLAPALDAIAPSFKADLAAAMGDIGA